MFTDNWKNTGGLRFACRDVDGAQGSDLRVIFRPKDILNLVLILALFLLFFAPVFSAKAVDCSTPYKPTPGAWAGEFRICEVQRYSSRGTPYIEVEVQFPYDPTCHDNGYKWTRNAYICDTHHGIPMVDENGTFDPRCCPHPEGNPPRARWNRDVATAENIEGVYIKKNGNRMQIDDSDHLAIFHHEGHHYRYYPALDISDDNIVFKAVAVWPDGTERESSNSLTFTPPTQANPRPPADRTAPAYEGLIYDGRLLVLDFDESLDNEFEPSPSRFSSNAVKAVIGDGEDLDKVFVEMDRAVDYQLPMGYVKPGSCKTSRTSPSGEFCLQDYSGNQVAGISSGNAFLRLSSVPFTDHPRDDQNTSQFSMSCIEVDGGSDDITVLVTNIVDEDSVADADDFTVTVDGNSNTHSATAVTIYPLAASLRKSIMLHVDNSIQSGSTVSLTYARGDSVIQDYSGTHLGDDSTVEECSTPQGEVSGSGSGSGQSGLLSGQGGGNDEGTAGDGNAGGCSVGKAGDVFVAWNALSAAGLILLFGYVGFLMNRQRGLHG